MRVVSCLGLLLGSLAAQAADAPPGWMDPRRRFAMTLPEGWRALTPDEGRRLAESPTSRMPADLCSPSPPAVLVFGDVDRWLAQGYDGRALLVLEQPGEPEVGPAGVALIQAHWRAQSKPEEVTYRVASAAAGNVGADAHPAILVELDVRTGDDRHPRFEAYVPTAGDTLIFSLRWTGEDAAAAWSRLAASIKLARRARGADGLGNKLLWAILVGVGIGAVLHAVRKRQRP